MGTQVDDPRTIVVNGKDLEVPSGTTVAGLLDRLEVSREGTAVELNREIVPRSRHEETTLDGGDRVEIVTAIGGG